MGHDPLPAIYFAIVLVVVILAAMLGAVVGPMALPVVPGKDKQLGSKPGFGAFGGVAGGLLGLLALFAYHKFVANPQMQLSFFANVMVLCFCVSAGAMLVVKSNEQSQD
jgi:uncharacterized BrkB/YihY/UPF0761 family membrane protein